MMSMAMDCQTQRIAAGHGARIIRVLRERLDLEPARGIGYHPNTNWPLVIEHVGRSVKMTTHKSALLAVLLGATVLSATCKDKDPIINGHRPAVEISPDTVT